MSRIFRVAVLSALAVAVSLAAAIAWAGAIGQQQAGVAVDAKGVLTKRTFNDPGNALTNERIAAAKVALRNKVGQPSPLRKVSLNRLQAAIDELRDDNREITGEMKNLAGLTRITHVFFYPELGEIVIAGPAEGWFEDLSGRVRGMETGLPTCQLQNFLVALRAFPPGKQGPDLVGCSIDPTAEGLRRMQDYLRRVRPRSPADGPAIAKGLCESLGMQNISVLGVPADTQFAHIMVEADYRMKLIGIGLEKPAVAFKNYVDRASAAQVSQNAMQRWYFVPDYQCVRMSEDRLAMELVGDGVKLIGEDELVTGDGQRQKNAKANLASKAFVETFTKKYPEMAAQAPVFAQLRVLIDMLVVAAHIQQEDYYGKARWQPKTLLDEEKLPVRVVNPAKQVETAANAIMKSNRLLTPVGGGVEIRAREALESKNRLRDDGGRVQSQRAEVSPKGLAKGQWWWD